MSWTILKNSFKRSWKLLLIFLLVLCFYLAVIISIADPVDMTQVQSLYGAVGGFLDAFGISIAAMTSMISYTASTFFGLLVMAFSMVFYIVLANSLIAKPVDDASIAYTLCAPVTRARLALTQGVYLILSMLVLFGGILATGAAMLSGTEGFVFAAYLNLVGVTCLLSTAMGMLSYFLSVAFCGGRLGMTLSSGVPIALLMMSMLGNAGGESLKWLKELSPFGWIDSVSIVGGGVDTGWMYLAFGIAIVLLLLATVAVFNRKRLPI